MGKTFNPENTIWPSVLFTRGKEIYPKTLMVSMFTEDIGVLNSLRKNSIKSFFYVLLY